MGIEFGSGRELFKSQSMFSQNHGHQNHLKSWISDLYMLIVLYCTVLYWGYVLLLYVPAPEIQGLPRDITRPWSDPEVHVFSEDRPQISPYVLRGLKPMTSG